MLDDCLPIMARAGWRGARSCRHENVVDLEIIHDLMLRRKKAETNKFLPLLHDGNVLVHVGSTMWRDRLRNGRRHPISDSVPVSQRNVVHQKTEATLPSLPCIYAFRMEAIMRKKAKKQGRPRN